MGQVKREKQIDHTRERSREYKDGLLRELKKFMKAGNNNQALDSVASLLLVDDSDRTALKALRKMLLASVEFVFHGCAEMLSLGYGAKCEAVCARVLRQTNRDKSFLNLLGAAVEAQGRLEEAIRIYAEVTRKDPSWSEARSNLGKAKLSLGCFSDAIEDFNLALRINPLDLGALLNRSSALFQQKLPDEALADLERLLSIDPRSVDGLLNKGILLLEQGKFDETEEVLRRLNSLDPRNRDVVRLEMDASMRKLDLKKASEIGEIGRQLFPDDTNFPLELAKVYRYMGKHELAFEKVKDVLRQNKPEVGVEPMLLGAKILQTYRLPTDEHKWLSAAIEMDPMSGQANYEMGNYYRRRRNWQAALTYYERVKAEIPFSTGFELEALYHLGRDKDYLRRHNELLEQGLSTVVSGALASHAAIELGTDVENSFCPSPMDFIFSQLLDSDETFISDALVKIEKIGDFRNQSLLHNGDQTVGVLLYDEPFLRQQLERIIRAAVQRYCEAFASINTPYLRILRNSPLTINAWAITMKTHGFLRPHIHEYGWLSGTLYLKVPPKGVAREGDIAFSTAGGDYPTKSASHVEKTVSVQEGLINLFPASLFHRTVPFEATKTSRVCIAFDVCPEQLNGVKYLNE